MYLDVLLFFWETRIMNAHVIVSASLSPQKRNANFLSCLYWWTYHNISLFITTSFTMSLHTSCGLKRLQMLQSRSRRPFSCRDIHTELATTPVLLAQKLEPKTHAATWDTMQTRETNLLVCCCARRRVIRNPQYTCQNFSS